MKICRYRKLLRMEEFIFVNILIKEKTYEDGKAAEE